MGLGHVGSGEPTRRQWREWTAKEAALAGVTYRELRAALADRSQPTQAHDELLGALVRLAQNGEAGAAAVLASCLWPGLMARTAWYGAGLDRDDAVGELVGALWEHVLAYDSVAWPDHVASRLLAGATVRLRRKAASERRYTAIRRPFDDPDIASVPAVEVRPRALLALAVTAGVITTKDAALVAAIDVEGRSLNWVARWAGCSREAAKKRRQRSLARLRAWLTDEANVTESEGLDDIA